MYFSFPTCRDFFKSIRDQQNSVRKERSVVERFQRKIISPSHRLLRRSTSWTFNFLDTIAEYNKAVKKLRDVHRRLLLMLSSSKDSLNYLKPSVNGCLCEHEIDRANKLASNAISDEISSQSSTNNSHSDQNSPHFRPTSKKSCLRPPLTCFYQSKDHWKTPPYYTGILIVAYL